MSLSNADLIALQPVLDATAKAVAAARLAAPRQSTSHELPQATGPVIWLSADFRSLLAGTGINFRLSADVAETLVHSVLEQAGPAGSVVVSAFNFDFPRSRCFDVANAPVQTGAFGQQLLSRQPQQRTAHPFYSLLVYGQAQSLLLDLPTSSSLLCQSTGPGSVFDWLIHANTELITVGHHYVKSLTAVHHAEHVAGVPFRYNKQFQGVVRRIRDWPNAAASQDEAIDCAFYVRELGVCDFSSLTERGDHEFRRQGLVHVNAVTNGRRPLLVHNINHAPAHQLMVVDLQSGNNAYTDYFGPNKPNVDVITGERADALYHAELRALLG